MCVVSALSPVPCPIAMHRCHNRRFHPRSVLHLRTVESTPELFIPYDGYISLVTVTEPGYYANHPLYVLKDLVLKLSLAGSCVAGSVTLLYLRRMRAPAKLHTLSLGELPRVSSAALVEQGMYLMSRARPEHCCVLLPFRSHQGLEACKIRHRLQFE